MAVETEKLAPPVADVATGYAKKSFEKAFADAIGQLPPFQPTHPDTLQTIRVIEMGAELGGFAGLHRVYVKVRRTHD